jgi:hypothetical protein
LYQHGPIAARRQRSIRRCQPQSAIRNLRPTRVPRPAAQNRGIDATSASLHATQPRRTGQIVGITVEVAASTQPAGELLTTDQYSQDEVG